MEDIKTQLANRLKEASNVLVTVTSNPSVDQLSAAIALTLILNRLGKHATAVFSGQVPSTIEFLHPEKTIEKTTDSLRDFIISLDKAKADKLRYKIEDQFVKIFITPYHTSINENDLVFSQGDFNVDVVVALGVHQREELDKVITAHGRILHDATVSTVNTQTPSTLGSINWSDKNSSSLCEMLVFLTDLFGKDGLLDAQIANSLLTGIVAETMRFSNQKTTSMTMSASSRLLAAGANQQLVATQLQPPPPPPPKPLEAPRLTPAAATTPPPPPKPPQAPPDKPNDKGEIHIDHGLPPIDLAAEEEQSKLAQVLIDEQGTLKTIDPAEAAKKVQENNSSKDTTPEEHKDDVKGTATSALGAPPAGSYMKSQPKSLDDNFLEPLTEEEDAPAAPAEKPPLLTHDSPLANTSNEATPPKVESEETKKTADLSAERGAVSDAIDANPNQEFMAPIESLNAQPLNYEETDSLPPNGVPSTDKPKDDDKGPNALPPPPVAPPLVPPPQP